MTLARKMFGLVALVSSAAPAFAQYTRPRPAPQGPTRYVFVAPPWITNGPRTGMPAGAMPPLPGAELPPTTTPVPSVVPAVPAIPPVAPPVVTPASATTTRTVTRPDVWRPGTVTVPGTVVPGPRTGR